MSVQLKIQRSVVEIGLDKPIRFLHVTDAHMDIDKSIGKEDHVKYFEEAMRYAKENDLRILCTGDNFKGVSDDNTAYALKHFSDERSIIIPGNHDFCGCPDNHGLDDPAYCNEYSEKLKKIYRNDIYFDSVIIDGVNFVTMQDVYYSIDAKQIALLEKKYQRVYP